MQSELIGMEGASQFEGIPCHEWRSVLLRSAHLWLLSTRWEPSNVLSDALQSVEFFET